MLQWSCKEACEPISVFHVSRPNEVFRYFPSASSEYKDSASLLCNVYGKVAFLKKQIFLDADDWQMDQAIRVDASLKGLLYISQVKFKSYSTEQKCIPWL